MNYEDTVQHLLNLHQSRKDRCNLGTARALSAFLGHPERAYPTIHIAGTNGKGSVSVKTARALECAGYKVGLFISPHILSYRERISINGEWISEEEVAEGVAHLLALCEEKRHSVFFFEITTFLAFEYFRRHNVDIAVIETGLGGSNDTTNVVEPLLSIITTISRDHTELLGNTLDAIASEKAGIIKPKVPVVLGSSAVRRPVLDKARQENSPVHIAPGKNGFYDRENNEIARTGLQLLKQHFSLSDAVIEEGLLQRPACRFDRRGRVILDVAHNPGGFLRLLEAIEEELNGEKVRFAVGLSQEKEIDACLSLLIPKAEYIYCLEAPMARAKACGDLMRMLHEMGYNQCSAEATFEETVQQAYEDACREEEYLVICGSFYIMASAMKALEPMGVHFYPELAMAKTLSH